MTAPSFTTTAKSVAELEPGDQLCIAGQIATIRGIYPDSYDLVKITFNMQTPVFDSDLTMVGDVELTLSTNRIIEVHVQ